MDLLIFYYGTFSIQLFPINALLRYASFDLPLTYISWGLLFLTVFSLIYKKRKILKYRIQAVYLLFLFFFIILIPLFQTKVDLTNNLNTTYLLLVNPFFIYICFHMVISNLNIKKFFLINYLTLVILTLILYFVNYRYYPMDRPEVVLSISDFLAFLGIITIIIYKNFKFITTFLILFTIYILVLFSSFTSVVFFVFSVFLWYLTKRRKIILKILYGSLILLLILFMLFILSKLKNSYITINHEGIIYEQLNKLLMRIHLVMNIQDASLSMRMFQLEEGLKIIRNSPFFGEFLYEIRVLKSSGSYIHSLLSFWAEYGIFSFAYIFVPFFIYFFRTYKNYKKNHDLFSEALFFSGIFIITIFIFSRSYASSIFWVYFSINTTYCLLYRKKNARNLKHNFL